MSGLAFLKQGFIRIDESEGQDQEMRNREMEQYSLLEYLDGSSQESSKGQFFPFDVEWLNQDEFFEHLLQIWRVRFCVPGLRVLPGREYRLD